MNKHFKILIALLAFGIFAFISCKKDEVKVMATDGTKPVLTASTKSLNYVEADSAKKAVDFSWPAGDYGYKAAISYYLQFSVKDANFSKVTEYGMGTALSKSFTVSQFNSLVLGLKYGGGENAKVYARVRSQITDSVYQYSDPVEISVTPYIAERVINYPHLYVPGAYQGWSPGAAIIAKLYSVNNDKKYEGYVNLTDPVNEFKLTPAPVWDNSYGMLTNVNNEGTMAYNGGDNFKISGAGYYLLKANTANNTWSATLNNWGIIGDAGNGWGDNDDIMLDFDANDQVLTKTVNLKVGEMKFRANKGWSLNIGKDGKYGGDNIKIEAAGSYIVTLDLRVPDEVIITITAQ